MLWLGCGGSIRENPVPNLDCDSAQATGEVRLTPNFANHLVMLFKYGLHQKSHIPGLLLSQPPLANSGVYAKANQACSPLLAILKITPTPTERWLSPSVPHFFRSPIVLERPTPLQAKQSHITLRHHISVTPALF